MTAYAKAKQPELIREERAEYNITPEDQARKETYRQRMREFLQDPASRQIEGFPIGDDEAILALSDPPYYTACPNPFLQEIIAEWQKERANSPLLKGEGSGVRSKYHREPFATDVSEGKNDPIYNAHSYHTKVPHKAIMRYILHYSEPGDIVFDGFCGTGMTGVAAQLCGDRKTVESMGYRVDKEGNIYAGSPLPLGEGRGGEVNKPISKLGARKAVLVDLSPAATFIAYNYNTPVDARAFEQEAHRILDEVEKECGWMYETTHTDGKTKGRINYTVWSDVYTCPSCGQEMTFWDAAVDHENGAIRETWPCPSCGATLAKTPRKGSDALRAERARETVFDRALGQTIRRAKQVPVLVNYSVEKKRHEKRPNANELAFLQKIEEAEIPNPFPIDALPNGFNTQQPRESHGMTHVHHFYTRRNLWILSAIHKSISASNLPSLLKNRLNFLVSSYNLTHSTRMTRIIFKSNGKKPLLTGHQTGTLYATSMPVEKNIIRGLGEKVSMMVLASQAISASSAVSPQSSTNLQNITTDSLDYIFVDPPFGGNLMYSELNLLWEAWLGVFTNNQSEAIMNNVQHKGLPDYQALMESCFREFYRVLKSGRWMTVEFHNSANAVWNSIQEGLLRAGFMVADVRTLDKQQGTFKQVTTSAAVKQDLIISAYKPNDKLEERFRLGAGTTEGAWDFIRYHLGQLPVAVEKAGELETVAERQSYLLFDRMVAFHIQRGASVPLSAAEFYAGLKQNFTERDGMYFLPMQVAEYDAARLRLGRVAQLSFFVSDEKTAIQWLRQQLDPSMGGEPKTFADLQPQFMRTGNKAKHEQMPELGVILEQNFLEDAEGKWHAPDPSKATDLERLRHKALMREFAAYVEGSGRLRQFRTEAVRAGFAEAYKNRQHTTILQVAARLPEIVLHEDPDLLMYFDTAMLRAEQDK